jgi:hypothetical protein
MNWTAMFNFGEICNEDPFSKEASDLVQETKTQ